MTHFLLPNWDGDRVSSPRYGDVAVPELLKKVAELGAQKSRLRAKIFGGAAIFQALDHEKEHLGHKNARFATDLLLQLQIPLVGKETGGRRGRRITFWTHTGECSVAEL